MVSVKKQLAKLMARGSALRLKVNLAAKPVSASIRLPGVNFVPSEVSVRQYKRTTKWRLKKMRELGNKVGWNLSKHRHDKSVTEECKIIGIDRNQFRSWVYNQKKKNGLANVLSGKGYRSGKGGQ